MPLGHGGVIQPSCAALFGLLLATVVLLERLPLRRAIGAAVIVAGLCVIGAEAIATIGAHGLLGDGLFALAGLMFASFGTLLRRWRVPPLRATVAVSVVSMVVLPIYWIVFGFDRLIAFGLWENLLQAVLQGLLAGPAAIYLFTRAIVLLGAGARGGVSDAGAAEHAADRLARARHRADLDAACRPRHRAARFPADAAKLERSFSIKSLATRAVSSLPARGGCRAKRAGWGEVRRIIALLPTRPASRATLPSRGGMRPPMTHVFTVCAAPAESRNPAVPVIEALWTPTISRTPLRPSSP